MASSWHSLQKFRAKTFLAALGCSAVLPLLALPTKVQASEFCQGGENCLDDSGSSKGSVKSIADQRFNQIITNRVLGTVLLGANEQIKCSDCVSGFGSAASFSAGIHGRKEIPNNLSILAGIAYPQY